MSIKKKLLLFILIILLLPLSLITFFSYQESKEGLLEFAYSQLDTNAHYANDKMRSVLEFELRNEESLLKSEELLSSLAESKLIKSNLPKNSYIFVINHFGRVLIHPNREKRENLLNYLEDSNESLRELTLEMIKGEEGKGEFSEDNQSMLVYYVPYGKGVVITGSSILRPKYDLAWTLAVATPKKHVLEKANKILVFSVLISILSLIVFAYLGFYLIHHTIVGPVLSLSKYMKNLGEEFIVDKRLVNNSNDEIGTLYDGFNKMIVRIEQDKEQLNDLHTYLQNIINSMPSVIISVDENLKINLWNTKAVELTSLSVLSVKNNCVVDILKPYKIDEELILSSMNKYLIQNDRVVISDGDNEEQIYDFTIYPVKYKDSKAAVIRIDDVTEKVRLEQMMIQTEKMMSLGGLAAGMAHEIKNPISAMLQGAQIVKRRLALDLDLNRNIAEQCGLDSKSMNYYLQTREIIKFIDGIRDSGHRASKIVADMLSFSRRSNDIKKSVKINTLLDTSLALASNDYDLKRNFDFKNIRIVKEYSEILDNVNCIENEIEQVILNLLKNAAQAIGYAQISENWQPTITLKTYKEVKYACIDIIDNGAGIPEDLQNRIFEPFFTTKPVGVGTGLGLSVSYFIIQENHGGIIKVESEPDKGTKFTIKLPL